MAPGEIMSQAVDLSDTEPKAEDKEVGYENMKIPCIQKEMAGEIS